MNVICLFLFRLLLYFWFVIIYILLVFFMVVYLSWIIFIFFNHYCWVFMIHYFSFFDFDLLLLFSFIYFSIVIMIIIFWDLKRGHHRHHHHHHHHHHHVISVYHFIWFSFVCLHLLRLCWFQIGNNQAIKLLDLLCVLVSYRSFTLWNNQLRKQFRSRMGFCSWQVAGLLLSVPFQQDVFIA
jgi:hypothetical protein